MSSPTVGGQLRIKRALRFLKSQPTCMWNFPWQSLPSRLTAYSDSDWASCPYSRRSTSGGGGVMLGFHLLTCWSRTQSSVALSSGEAELNAMLKTECEGLGLKYLLEEIGVTLGLHIRGDSAASHGTLHRLESGRIKHLHTRQLWLQGHVYSGEISIEKIPRAQNWADVMTHAWNAVDYYHFIEMGVSSQGP